MNGEKQVFGRQGEADAADEAVRRGYTVLERNYRTPHGELDLILRSPENTIVFVEVKARTGSVFGYPENAVDDRKRTHIISSAYCYLNRKYPDEEIPWRVDIIALIYKKDQKTIRDFKWFENVTADD